MRNLIERIVMVVVIGMVATAIYAQLPSVSLKDIDGKTIDTAKLDNEGKPFVISFFATWCKPCNRELKAISEQYADWQDETGMKVVAISIDQAQNINKVKPMVDAEGWEYEVLLEGVSKRSKEQLYGRTEQNKVVIIDRQGHRIGDTVRGKITASSSATLKGELATDN